MQSGDCFDWGYFGGSVAAGAISGAATGAIAFGAGAVISAAARPIIAAGSKAIPALGKALSSIGNKMSNFFKSTGRNANKGGKPLSPKASQSNSGTNSLNEENINYIHEWATNKNVPHIFDELF